MQPPLWCDVANGYECPNAIQEISEKTLALLGRGQALMVVFLPAVLRRGTQCKFIFLEIVKISEVRLEVVGSGAVCIRISWIMLKRADVHKHMTSAKVVIRSCLAETGGKEKMPARTILKSIDSSRNHGEGLARGNAFH